MSVLTQVRLVILQYAGDFREAYHLLTQSGKQEYFSHRYTIESSIGIGSQIDEVIHVCCQTSSEYSELLAPGLRAVGGNLDPYKEPKRLLDLLQRQKPTHLVVHFPLAAAFKWAKQNNVRVMGLFADSFQGSGLSTKLRNFRLSTTLNNEAVDLVANHGLSACHSLKHIGVKPSKIIPWDFPYEITPKDFAPKKLGKSTIDNKNIVYVGRIAQVKGVSDALNALVELKQSGITPNLTLIGKGELDWFRAEISRLELDEQVTLVGGLSHDQVLAKMRWADVVLVPSRHAYPEGLPLTIYEALTVRTPLILSDHPMFLGKFELGRDVLMFPEKDVAALAYCIKTLLTNAELYQTLSLSSAAAWSRLQLPVKWHQLIEQWITDTPESRRWLFQHSLEQCSYQQQQLSSSRLQPALTSF
ncbi:MULTISPECIES: glycosyltransferase family 4 protein [Cyanophyceae]|uniref:glycosyltransferase family 4 protein n=1 Tax=Cyanophyceae TaxID=3028117 RepID=UPI0016820618|nr:MULTISPECIES: glycosyltransferase family 4 protein [Cyanophyceae]MBD1916101.1 glycosyltransferase family 4 protein [Phormidium sp. FACHB-77]MBD2031630.1 glycosyltransferase family 4 protein [Phormidium sp. FACHB-322]MBD2052743.1 glycosyltransferase family 4 protein [Leptolyngbya sp. FACHB-60]